MKLNRKTILNILFPLGIGLMVFLSSSINAQQNPCYRVGKKSLPGLINGVIDEINLPIGFTLNKKVNKADFAVYLDLGEDYIYGTGATDFSIDVTYTLLAKTALNATVSGVFNASPYTLTINNKNPEAIFSKDITTLASGTGDFNFSKVAITINTVTISGGASAAIKAQIQNSLRMSLNYTINYGFDIAAATPVSPIAMSQNQTGSREVKFSWATSNNQEFCNYEFQLLRLYNQSETTASNENNITTTINWDEALTLQTESGEPSLKLTVAEGQGYYIWRVRPIGSYYPGGIANPLNLNNAIWSAAPASGSTIQLNAGTLASIPTAFFFNDPDDKINRIYSRTFTEGNKMSERTTYANGLMQERQTQSYLPSVDTTLVVQHVLDMSGRPALTTMPAPEDSSMYLGYKKGFFKNESGGLYTAKDYDLDGNYDNPARGQNQGAFNYYSQNNPNTVIPDAQGYAYQRTQYYNDGTNRVKQQSGVGKQQMIGSGTSATSDGEGKTVKTYYGSPSEQELIQLFGDEAPSSENVFKTINVDQNNTATVTLTNKEGKVIATSLAFQDQDNDGIFEPLDNETAQGEMNQVSDTITRNVKTENGFISSKRIALLQATPMSIGYQIGCDTLSLPCADGEVDCGYRLKIQIFNLDDNTAQVIYDQLLSNIPCIDVPGKTGKYKTLAPITVNLNAGNYIVQKTLTVGSVEAVIVSSQEKVDNQVKPLSGLIVGWLNNVKCESQLVTFYDNLKKLAVDVNTNNISSYNFPSTFTDIYDANPAGFSITLLPATGNPRTAVISTPCCGNINVPVVWSPPFRCPDVPMLVDKNGNGVLDVYPYNPDASPDSLNHPEEFFPDFEGYARVFMGECWDSLSFYGQYMEGWKPGEFNLMVYHMLTDQYNCTNNFPNDTPVEDDDDQATKILLTDTIVVYNSCGDSIGVKSEQGLSYGCSDITIPIYNVPTVVPACNQYTCQDLFNCWAVQLSALRAIQCLQIVLPPDDNNVANRTDQQNGGFDSNFKDNFKGTGPLAEWISKRAIEKRMRDLQGGSPSVINPQYERHLVQDFLQCTGYRYAKILTQYDPLPLASDIAPSGVDYKVAAENELQDIDLSKKTNGDYYYMNFKDWAPGKTIDNPTTAFEANSIEAKGFFPFIKNPIYAFKYFEYPFEATDDYQELELLTCYSDPNECYKDYNPHGGTPLVRIPCCVSINSDGSYNTSQCYKDYEYPNIENLPLDADPVHPDYGVLQDGQGKYKLTIRNFCSMGRMGCKYTSDVWSCNQRSGFYKALKNYQIRIPKFPPLDLVHDCDYQKTPRLWFDNTYNDTQDTGYPDLLSAERSNNFD